MNKIKTSLTPAVTLLVAELGAAVYFVYHYLPQITSNFMNVVLVGCLLTITLVFWLTIFQFKRSWINRGIYFLFAKTDWSREEVYEYEEVVDDKDSEVELLTIAYGTKKSVAPESAKKIANLLQNKFGLEIDILDLKDNPSLNQQFNNIIIGSSLEIGKWTTHTAVVKFLEKNMEYF